MKLFGTDGIRGVAGKYPLDEVTIKRIAIAAAKVLKEKSPKKTIIIGRDTRESGEEIVSLLKKEFLKSGLKVWDLGVIPTPGVSYLTKKYPVLAGVVVSASHNPYHDNGIKFFSHRGTKLADSVESEIEKHIKDETLISSNVSGQFKKLSLINQAPANLFRKYATFLKNALPTGFSLKNFKIALDCANGATYQVAPNIFVELGADITTINASPDGKNINLRSGSLHPHGLASEVLKIGANCGMAFDGDGDRVIFIDEKGIVRDGDYVLALCSLFLKKNKKLRNNTLVTTVMANLGLFRAMEQHKIKVLKTPVGDRYVYENMKQSGAVIGGEQSGHIIFRKYLPTGDGILSALQVLNVMNETGKTLSDLCAVMVKYPQVLVNMPVAKKVPVENLPTTSQSIKNAESKLKSDGRILVRYSGTENLLRVMIEGLDEDFIAVIANEIAQTAEKEILANWHKE